MSIGIILFGYCEILLRRYDMEIKAVKFRKDGFYTQPMVMGGEEGMEQYNKNVRYRGSLQNYLIDTGDEVILVDTGIPSGTPEEVPDENSLLYTGKDICSYLEAFDALGYKREQVTKILLTHKHADHSGEISSFPNAKVYVNEEEMSADELKGKDNLVPVKFTDGAYYNFPESQKIQDGIYFIKAKGHTNGNSIVIVENDGLFYMIHGDITYVDEALYENKLSIVFEDLAAARETMDRVREFVKDHPTVYCGTHTPQGYENLEAKRVIDLDHPVETVLADVDFSSKKGTGKYVCSVCGYVYDPSEHDGVAFEDLPDYWTCPRCKQPKEKFNKA
jgi:glyoxylase-like metal-dependent hydrolase (beta-lactamase superfamily II)/rubredoxin